VSHQPPSREISPFQPGPPKTTHQDSILSVLVGQDDSQHLPDLPATLLFGSGLPAVAHMQRLPPLRSAAQPGSDSHHFCSAPAWWPSHTCRFWEGIGANLFRQKGFPEPLPKTVPALRGLLRISLRSSLDSNTILKRSLASGPPPRASADREPAEAVSSMVLGSRPRGCLRNPRS
jgi:hypothetical protein